MSLREVWDAQADDWIRFATDPAGDEANPLYNLPRFLELLPPPGRRTLDLGCGEGRLGRALRDRGHHVVGVDSSPRMAQAARESIATLVADAAALPFDDGSFDLVGAFMSLQDFDDLDAAVCEAARVLERGGRFGFAVQHPLASAGTFESRQPDSPFVVAGSYLAHLRHDNQLDRDGFRFTFSFVHRPLESYARALEAAGLLIEAVREPEPVAGYLTHESRRRWLRIPLFLHVRAVKP